MRWPKPRLPSFGVAAVTSVAVLAIFVAWAFRDASFSYVLELGDADTSLYMLTTTWQAGIAYAGLAVRLLLFTALVLLAGASLLCVTFRLFVGKPSGRSLRAWSVAIALFAMWLTFVRSNETLRDAGLQWRARGLMPGIRADAASLMAKWPTTDGRLPFSGMYSIQGDSVPASIFIFDPEKLIDFCPWTESIGPWISKAEDGGLRFDVGASYTKVEYHPLGNLPVSYSTTFHAGGAAQRVDFNMEKQIQLEPDWFLVWYTIADVD